MRFWLLALTVTIAVSAANATEFERVFGGAAFDRGVCAIATHDGGYLAVGATGSSGAGDLDIYLVKIDAAGGEQWSRTYGGPAEENGWSVRETNDGIVLAGYTRSFGAGGYDFFLVKTDSAGNEQWTRTFGGEADDRCWALAIAPDGGFFLAGETKSEGAGEEDWFVVATDAEGTERWSRTYGGEQGDRCFAVTMADDGGLVLAGQTFSEGAGDRDAQIIKTAPDGELEWSRTFGGAASDVGHGVVRTSDGDFMMTGYTTSLAEKDDDPLLVKIGPDGEVRWTRVLAMDGVNHTITGAEATGGGFYLTGFSEYPARGANAALLIRADADGQLVWHRDLYPTQFGKSMGYTVSATADGGCVFAGHTTVEGSGGFDLLLVKVGGETR